MRVSLNFGELRADDAPHQTPGVTLVSGAYASANGYRPVGGFMAFAEALAGPFKGAGSFIGTGGDARLIAGDGTALYSADGGSWSSVIGSLTVNGRWRFTQFGDDIICVNGGAPVRYRLTADSATLLGGSPPVADLCATVRDFVVLGRVGGENNVVQWSAIGDATVWAPGSGQAGLQPIYAGGKIMGLTSGEVCHIIQRFQIVRMAYTGDAADPWQFDTISTNDGCLAEGSVIQAGGMFFFYGDRGFTMFDGAQFRPIGAERIDRSFREQYSVTDLDNMWAAVDPLRTLAIWSMPQRLWMYNWTLDLWTVADVPVAGVFPSFSEGVGIDDLDAIYGDLDSMSPLSLDDPRFTGGAPRLTVVHSDGRFGVLSGENIAARIILPHVELAGEREARIGIVRPVTDATTGLMLTADSRRRLGDSESITSFAQLNARGDMPVRIAARSLRLTLDIAAATDWDYVQGLEIDFAAGGRA